jgi:hypothetical protein
MPRPSVLIEENLSQMPQRSMLTDYQEAMYPIDRRLKIAELASQAQSKCGAGDGSISRTTSGDIEALDLFMAAVTNEKLFKNDGEMLIAVAPVVGILERSSPGKAEWAALSK